MHRESSFVLILLIRFYFRLLYTDLLSNFFLIFKFYNFLIFFWTFFIFYQKDMHLVLSECLLHVLFFRWNMHCFSMFVTNERFKFLFYQKEPYLVLLFINIYIVYQNRAFMLMKCVESISVLSNFMALSLFIYGIIFYACFLNL